LHDILLQNCLIDRFLNASIATPRGDRSSLLFANGKARTISGQRYLIVVAAVMAIGICCDGALQRGCVNEAKAHSDATTHDAILINSIVLA
jgi:hypothetical protein